MPFMHKLSFLRPSLLVIVVVTVAALGLSGCSGSADNPSSAGNGSASAPGDTQGGNASGGGDQSASASPAAPPPAATLSHSATWSFTNSQHYTYDMTLSLGELIKGSAAAGVAHPNGPKFVVGANCPVDSATSAVIPGSMTVTATTVEFATPISAGFLLTKEGPGDIKLHDGKISIDVDYGQCFAQNSDNFALIGGVGVTWQTPFTKGQSGRMDFFIVIHNYYSPATPNGDTAYLGEEVVVPDLAGSNTSQAESDKMYRPIANSVKGIALSGQVLSN